MPSDIIDTIGLLIASSICILCLQFKPMYEIDILLNMCYITIYIMYVGYIITNSISNTHMY